MRFSSSHTVTFWASYTTAFGLLRVSESILCSDIVLKNSILCEQNIASINRNIDNAWPPPWRDSRGVH